MQTINSLLVSMLDYACCVPSSLWVYFLKDPPKQTKLWEVKASFRKKVHRLLPVLIYSLSKEGSEDVA